MFSTTLATAFITALWFLLDANVNMLKYFDSEESRGETALVVALSAAIDVYDADVIVMSWVVGDERKKLYEAIQYAASQGAVLVASAGNLSLATGLGTSVYPAAWDEVIGIGGLNLDEQGEPVSSLWYLTGDAVYVCTRGEFNGENGSSFAAPRVAAVIAAYFADNPDAQSDQAK